VRIEQDPDRLLATFLDTTLELTRELDVETVLLAVVDRSMELTGADYGAAVTLDSQGGIESFQYRGLTPEQVALLPHLPEGKGLLGLVIESRETIRLERMQDHEASVGFPDHHVPMKGFLGVPLQNRGELVGALYLTKSPDLPPFDEADERFFETMGGIATVGITNARLFTAEKERAERSEILSEIASKVRRSLDVDEVLAATVETLGHVAQVDRCFIRLVDADTGEPAEVHSEWDGPDVASLKDAPDVNFPISSLAITKGSTQWTDDVMEDDRLTGRDAEANPMELVEQGTRAVIASPLEWGDETLGVVAFHSRTPRKWTEGEIALIEAAAREVSIALFNARRFARAVETADRLRALDEMRSDFVAMVSHELRSPMTVVAGIADILQKRSSALSADQRSELVDTLGREARRLTRLVSEVLDLEAIDQGGVELRLDEVDLAGLAREAVTDAGAAERTELAIERGNAVVTADADRIKQVLLNLISNAVKFSEEGTLIKVAVSPESTAVRISVIDEGPGITDTDKKKLFQRFSRLDPIGERKPGSGLGLYLSRSIVEAHGGEIWVESVPGEGATFCMRVPRNRRSN
jgi:signal transduction histidine kinase